VSGETACNQFTLESGSSARQASRMASDLIVCQVGSMMRHERVVKYTWSAILSGWPSPTDSEVKRKVLPLVPFTW
jgi:hypothetical protein